MPEEGRCARNRVPVIPVQLDQIRTVYNERWRTGMGSSLCAALLALTETGPSEVGAVVVALADQPLVGADAVARLIAAYRDGAGVAGAAYDGRPRKPVLLAPQDRAQGENGRRKRRT